MPALIRGLLSGANSYSFDHALCFVVTTLTFTPLANASEQTRGSAVHKTTHLAKASESKKKTTTEKTSKKSSRTETKTTAKAGNKKVAVTKKIVNQQQKYHQ